MDRLAHDESRVVASLCFVTVCNAGISHELDDEWINDGRRYGFAKLNVEEDEELQFW